MTLTPAQLTQIRARVAETANTYAALTGRPSQPVADRAALLAEVDRLRAELESNRQRWYHNDQSRTICVAGHDPETRQCADGGGPVLSEVEYLTQLVEIWQGLTKKATEGEDKARGEVDLLRAQVADYENRTTWHTTCGGCAGHLDREYAADHRAAQAEAERDRWKAATDQAGLAVAEINRERGEAQDRATAAEERLAAVWALVEPWRDAEITSAAIRELVTALLAIRDQEQDATNRQSTYLVWSNEQRTWWRPNGSGYTGDVWAAGRYNEAEAVKACGLRTWSQGAPPPEVMVLAPEHGRATLTVDDIRAVPDLMRGRIAEATRAAIAAREADRG